MAEVVYSERALLDLERLAEFLEREPPQAGTAVFEIIISGIDILDRHPLVGRPAERGLRELVISRGKTGHLALYSYERREDVVLVLAIRHQREAGYLDLG